jgi:hypothetical protein
MLGQEIDKDISSIIQKTYKNKKKEPTRDVFATP